MTLNSMQYPALYESASSGSDKSQRWFLWAIRSEYLLLFFISSISATRNHISNHELILTISILILSAIFVCKSFKKLDQDWYRCRALAESIKTTTWRFSMRAHPFEDAENIDIPKAHFRNLLKDILRTNKGITAKLSALNQDQVTASMIILRNLNVKERLGFYVKNRIDDQRRWYIRKSAHNKKAMNIWILLMTFIYFLAILSINSNFFGFTFASYAFDPLIVIITSLIGWIQIKRHSELTASYNLTAHEIGIIHGKAESVKTEMDLSDFVNEAELAFSREHTQWVARRDAN
ncbi:DUF4231 domain-containing protein [Pacificispira sp.]|uniref:DUF4231 domain-containing protein n=1 Tax=Pacificispira sp. TaxID=2888761 RepID=UPI003BAC2612